MINRKDYGLWFALSSSLLFSLAVCPLFGLIIDDKEFFRYTGLVILKGEVPYRDFFDHKPPLIYFINAAGLFFGRWGLWMINAGLALTITILLFRISRRYRLAYPWLLPFLFNLMIRDNLVSEGTDLTREYSTFFVMFFFIVLMGKNRYRYFLLGLFTALVSFTQQDQVLSLLPFFVYVLFFEKMTTSVWVRILQLAAGFLSVAMPIVLYFAWHHALGDFWQDAYLFNFTWYIREKKSIGEHFRTVKRVLDTGNYELPFMIALTLGITSLFLQNKKKGLVIAAILALLLSMSSELMGGRLEGKGVPQDFNGYFLPFSATVCILLFTVFAFTSDRIIADRRAQLPYALLLCMSLCYTQLQHGTHLERRKDQEASLAPSLDWLKERKLTDYQLYIMLDESYGYYYSELKVLAPTPWVYQHFWLWYANWDADQAILQSIGRDLLRHRTTYILMDPQRFAGMNNPVSMRWWMTFLQEHYESLTVPGNPDKTFWKLKENQ